MHGVSYYFKKTKEPEQLFYLKCWSFSKLKAKGLVIEETLKLAELHAYKKYYECSYSPEIEAKIQQYFG